MARGLPTRAARAPRRSLLTRHVLCCHKAPPGTRRCPVPGGAAGRAVAAPRLVLRRRRRVRHSEGCCCVAPRVGFSKHSEHPFFCRTKLADWGKTDPALFYSTASFTRTKLTGPKSTGPVGRPLRAKLQSRYSTNRSSSWMLRADLAFSQLAQVSRAVRQAQGKCAPVVACAPVCVW